MRLLLIDTSGGEGSVALAEGERELRVTASEQMPGRSASERLIPVIREMLNAQGWRLNELSAIAVVHGPGSFTGVRVGVSAAKGLSEAGKIPLIAISRLAVLADVADRTEGDICAVLDAGRGEFYCGVYARGQKASETLLTADEVAATAQGTATVVVCEPRVAEALRDLGPRLVAEPRAADVLPLVAERVAAGEFEDVATLDANYLRRTDLEIFAKMAKIPSAGSAG